MPSIKIWDNTHITIPFSINIIGDKEKLLSIFTRLSPMFLPFRTGSFENEVEVEKIISVKIPIKNNEVLESKNKINKLLILFKKIEKRLIHIAT